MENLIGVGNNKKIPFNPMILKKQRLRYLNRYMALFDRDRPDLGNIFNLYMFEQ